MDKEYYYSDTQDPEAWTCTDMCEAADEAWLDHNDEPAQGDTVKIYRGVSAPISINELNIDLREWIEERLYEIAGEAAELTTIGDDLQSDFEQWLSENIEINICRIIDIEPVTVKYDGSNWCLVPPISTD